MIVVVLALMAKGGSFVIRKKLVNDGSLLFLWFAKWRWLRMVRINEG